MNYEIKSHNYDKSLHSDTSHYMILSHNCDIKRINHEILIIMISKV